MKLTCPRCHRAIALCVIVPRYERYEVRTTCPGCGCKIAIKVGLRVAIGPTETKEAQ